MSVTKKIEEARVFLEGLSGDINDFLMMAQVTVPMVEQTVERAKLRISQVESLFGKNEDDDE